MIKRFHKRMIILFALIAGLMLAGVLWAMAMYVSATYAPGASGLYFRLMIALAPILGILLVVLAVFELRKIKR